MSRCVWCGKESNEVKEIMVLSPNRVVANRYEVPLFVCPEHEEKLQRSCDRLRRDGGSSSVLFIILTFALVISAFIAIYLDKHVWSLYLLNTNLVVFGLKLAVFPIGLGIPGSIRFTTWNKLQRIMGGIILAGAGISFALMCWASYIRFGIPS
jgi:hypothetical protein